MRSAQITIKDIAKQLGISPSTVSRALKDHPDISIKTKKSVNELAAKLNYKPNAIALSLRNSRSNVIGLIIPELVHHFFSSVISGVEEVAYSAGYNVMICQSDESYTREVTSAQALLASRVDGLLVSVSKETENFTHLKNIYENGIPLVFFDRTSPGVETDSVVVDDEQGGFMATEHLIEEGCRRIAHFGAPQNLLIGRQRKEGYLKALQKYDIPVDNQIIKISDTYEKALLTTRELLDLPKRPDGIFAVNDLAAIAAMQVIKENGLRVPHDIAIVGFTNGQAAILTDPKLTTVEQRGREMGQTAANLLITRIKNQNVSQLPVTTVLKTELIVRESSRKSLARQKRK